MKIALKIGYEGMNFSGSQIQPDKRTVEGELLTALKNAGVIDNFESANLSSAGRTDAGVHSYGQVVSFFATRPELALPRVINNKLPRDLWAWASAEVPDNFDPRRHAVRRKYRYILTGDYDISKMREAAKLILGEHDFSNFSKKDKKCQKTTIRRIEKLDIRTGNGIIRIDIEANAFLWNMVRKIVTALTYVGSDYRSVEWIEQMLDPENYEEGIEPAPAYGLTLTEVGYNPEPEWSIDGYAIKSISDYYAKEAEQHKIMSTVMGYVVAFGKQKTE
ncbi:tRNA pseudouridine(38-40) synthase TruA [Methanolapillus ohkumae]|uniref:tRNA pseudouridine synthase A n=1 Tax=Methanolapillus ohkumae TaxID=3028298 RepID=A0AA96ZXC4_9EURY|nr:tRNA pseudouridine synthase A [Methanosarcinaceae archaeon Am2]